MPPRTCALRRLRHRALLLADGVVDAAHATQLRRLDARALLGYHRRISLPVDARSLRRHWRLRRRCFRRLLLVVLIRTSTQHHMTCLRTLAFGLSRENAGFDSQCRVLPFEHCDVSKVTVHSNHRSFSVWFVHNLLIKRNRSRVHRSLPPTLPAALNASQPPIGTRSGLPVQPQSLRDQKENSFHSQIALHTGDVMEQFAKFGTSEDFVRGVIQIYLQKRLERNLSRLCEQIRSTGFVVDSTHSSFLCADNLKGMKSFHFWTDVLLCGTQAPRFFHSSIVFKNQEKLIRLTSWPGLKPSNGMTRCPNSLPLLSSHTQMRSVARLGSTTCREQRNTTVCVPQVLYLSCQMIPKLRRFLLLTPPTFLKTNGSSSQTGHIALPGIVLVLNFFRTVSAGRPYMSTSTYVPTFLSDKNWPDITCNSPNHERFKPPFPGQTLNWVNSPTCMRMGCEPQRVVIFRPEYLDGYCSSNDAVNSGFRERIEVSVLPPHEVGLQNVAASAVVLKYSQVQHHGQI